MGRGTDEKRTPWWRVAAVGVGVSLLVGVVLLAFSWPAVTAAPADLPIGISGSDDQIAQVGDAIDEQSDGAIELIDYDDRDAAVAAVEQREVYGAIILPMGAGAAPEVLTATAASPVVAQLLQSVAAQQQRRIDTQPPPITAVEVTDVVPLADTDPRGSGLGAAMFPMVLGGVLGGAAATLLIRPSGARRAVGLLVYAPAAGLVVAGILQGLYGVLLGDFFLNAGAIALAILSIAAPVTGLAALLGTAGVGIGAAFMILLANPISASTVPVEFIAAPWGDLGQWLPPGAAATLLRTLSYFPAADTTFSWLVLTGWAIVGMAATLLVRPARRVAAPAPATLNEVSAA